jgi:hypothetical protein
MKKMTIFRLIKDSKIFNKIIGREVLRVINVGPTFIGIGEKGEINHSEFKKLADYLEPKNEGYSIV